MMDNFIHSDEMWSSRHCCFTTWWDVYSIIIIIEIIIDCYAKDNLTICKYTRQSSNSVQYLINYYNNLKALVWPCHKQN